MDNKYKIIVSKRGLYKEFELATDADEIRLGTNAGCDLRLRKDLFFEPFELTMIKNDGAWSVFSSENVYISVGDSRKLMTLAPAHGEIFSVKYRKYDTEVISVEFLIDFDSESRSYERIIDIKRCQSVRIGASPSSQIQISSPFITDDEIEIVSTPSGYELSIIRTGYGVYLNGVKVQKKAELAYGDFISVSDFIFCIKDGSLMTEIRDGMRINGLEFVDEKNPNEYPKFNRNSRIHTVINKDKIEILDPPAKPQKSKSNLFISLLPSLGMLLTSGLMASMGGSMMVFSLISGGMAIVTAIITAIQNRMDFKKECKERIEKYTKYSENKQNEIKEQRDIERVALEQIYTDIEKERSMLRGFSGELFDRSPDDEDFLCVRLGLGSVKAAREIEYKKQERLEIEDDLQLVPERISKEFADLKNAPVVCRFKDSNAVGIIGKEQDRFALMKNIIIDICARQYHNDVKLFFISRKEHSDRAKWLRLLPHVHNDMTNSRNIACDDESKNRVFDFLYKELSQREQGKKGEHIVVFFYDEYGFQTHPISNFAGKLKELDVTFVFMADKKSDIAQGCSYLVWLDSDKVGRLMNTADQTEITEFSYRSVSDKDAESIATLLAPVYTEEISLEGALTKNVSLFEMLNIIAADDLDLTSRWAGSAVYRSMAAPLGVTKSETVYLDLHDKAHGPHGLVAGTTGSGKSEILQTYILSMATLFHPYEVGFVIIDFKGGGMVNQFKELPHLVGAITNIDGKEIDRSLKSIKAELQKRQRLFAEAEVNHIDKYIKKFKTGEVSVPLPHLILIVDEFAELKAEQPEFMKELISAARIGRSLGVHLILATQKPSGQVDDQIWSNSKFKLCLKVQSKEDSNEVLKSPLAAEIKEPGRAYLQVGNNEIFELFQSAYSGAPEKMDGANVKEYTVSNVSLSGKRTPIFVQKKQKSGEGSATQLEAIVKHVNEYCTERRIERLPNICLPPLPSCLDFPETVPNMHGNAVIGIYDDPENQMQGEVGIDIQNKNTLIIGSSQYGKTNILQSLIRTVADTCSPDEANIYILDFGSMVLKNFEGLCHVGGVVCASEDEKLKNLFKLLFDEIKTRKEKLVSVGVSSYSSYVEAGYTDIPRIYLLVDNLTALIELYLEDDDSLLNIVREGISVGISTVIANAQTSGIGYKYMSNFANKIALYCNDSSEYMNLFDSVQLHPDEVAGRCILELDKRIVECQTYLAFGGEKEIDRVRKMQDFIASVNQKYPGQKAKKIPSIPSTLTADMIKSDFNAQNRRYSPAIGLTYNEVEPYYLDLSGLGIMGLCGKENTGHRNFIRNIIRSLEENTMNAPANVVILDDASRRLAEFKESPIVRTYTLDTDAANEILGEWYDELNTRYDRLVGEGSIGEDAELLLMIVQNNDLAKKISDDFDMNDKFNEMLSRFKGLNFAVIFANYQNASVSYDAPDAIRTIKQDQHVIFFEDLDNLKPFDVAYEEIKANRKHLGVGDAYYINDNLVVKLKLVKAE